jgi:hypothetical protein
MNTRGRHHVGASIGAKQRIDDKHQGGIGDVVEGPERRRTTTSTCRNHNFPFDADNGMTTRLGFLSSTSAEQWDGADARPQTKDVALAVKAEQGMTPDEARDSRS